MHSSASCSVSEFTVLLDTLFKPFNLEHPSESTLQHAMQQLCQALNELKARSSADQWKELITSARIHPLRERLLQDPFTKRVFEKPRGYAGDAVMLDYLYNGANQNEQITPVGRSILNFLKDSPAGVAVRNRAEYIGHLIDKMAESKSKLRVLSVASGHARELKLSNAFLNKDVSFAAIDMDKLSLDHLQNDYQGFDLELLPWSVTKLLKKENRDFLGRFDLVYSCGLYDYLSDPFAKRLTELLACDLVKPGGKMVIANFMHHFIEGYMETFMDWNLIYRNSSELEALDSNIPPELVAKKNLKNENSNTIVFLEMDLSTQKNNY